VSLQTLAIFAAAFGVAVVFGYALGDWLLPPSISRRLTWALAPGLGTGVCSFIFFVFRRPMLSVEMILLIAAARTVYRGGRMRDLFPGSWQPPALGLVFTAALGLMISIEFFAMDRNPHGGWDGWAIWNTHARLMARAGPNWENLLPYTFQGDYPLLVPASVARLWRYAHMDIPEAGALVGILFGVSGIVVLTAVLYELRGASIGMVMGLVLTGTPLYLSLMTAQYADVPLSFFILATLSLVCLHFELKPENKSMLSLAGFAAGCAGWTKNEGLLFVAAVGAVLLAPVIQRKSKISDRFIPFMAGLLIPLSIIGYFKWTVPVQNYLIEGQRLDLLRHQFGDLDRYLLIAKGFSKTFWTFGQWPILTPFVPLFLWMALRGLNRQALQSPGWRAGCAVLAMVLAGYAVVYLISPINLSVHLHSSFDRLVLHLWPSFLLLLGLCGRNG
jgi:hypothetical protein